MNPLLWWSLLNEIIDNTVFFFTTRRNYSTAPFLNTYINNWCGNNLFSWALQSTALYWIYVEIYEHSLCSSKSWIGYWNGMHIVCSYVRSLYMWKSVKPEMDLVYMFLFNLHLYICMMNPENHMAYDEW